MLYAENELNLISDLQMLFNNEIYLLPTTDEVEEILEAIRSSDKWAKWTHSFGKDVPPPDFFSDELGLMLEVMRVDDHGFKKKGHIINPTYEREHKLEKELRDLGILDVFPNANLVINADTGLETEKDHNYTFYLENFKRTVNHHLGKVKNYHLNHQNHKLIFFVFDESSAYFEASVPKIANLPIGQGRPHLYMFDKAFTEVFINAEGLDYLIWVTPYKRIDFLGEGMVLPMACVYKIGEALPEQIIYSTDKMVSVER